MCKGHDNHFVCVCICLSVPELQATTFICTYRLKLILSLIVRNIKRFQLVNIAENAWLQSYGIVDNWRPCW